MNRIIVRNYKILLIIPTHPIFAAKIERSRVASADFCVRQERPEVQRITPPPIFVVDLVGTPVGAEAAEIVMCLPCFL